MQQKQQEKQSHYPAAEANPDIPKIEEEVLKQWQQEDSFKQSIANRPAQQKGDNNEFIFYDGPPFANGLPHYGHLLTGFVKDIVARYQTMQGKRVERRFGWDCHGLPAEMGTEKELNISGRHQIMEYGVDKFNDHCRSSVMKYTKEWQQYVGRQARWVDFDNDYKTMDTPYIESVLWAFKQLFDKGLVYESMRVMPYSWACETPLSNFETRLDNAYRERKDKAVTVGFKLNERPKHAPEGHKEYRILAWTTTPWTLPSNLALGVGHEINYVAIPKDNICYIIAKFAIKAYAKELGLAEDASFIPFKGKELEGLSYQPLFDYFKDHDQAFSIFADEFVTEGDGTGIVHLAPGFGEDDQKLCEDNGIKLVCPVDSAGKFTAEIKDFEGQHVFDANDGVIIKLKEQGDWLKTEQYIHNYPHCWRTDTPLIYKAVPSWYVEVTKFKDRMVELNQQINWIPGHIKDGLFGKWLANARDWSISRNRFWGAPIPVWRSDNPDNKELYVFGSIQELEEFFDTKVEDLHKPFIDTLTKPDPKDPKYTLRRVDDVFDCWFESGSMPYAQVHYPFENKDWFEQHCPSDFIVEYVAQTRGWFYTMMVLSTALFDKPPFLNCICHGVVLDDKGQKLSKRLNNYTDPMEIFHRYGADALRWVMVSAPIMHGGELLIDKEGNMVRDAVRLVLKPVWNAYHFFVLYANADGVKAEQNLTPKDTMDRYILAKAKSAMATIKQALDGYDLPLACHTVERFFETLNNWYIRRTKERFWKSEHDTSKQEAYNTLYTVLDHLMRAMCPLLPLVTDKVYRGINPQNTTSVHLQDFPDITTIADEAELVLQMDRVQDICNAALAIRNAENIRVRQPLATLTIVAENAEQSLKPYEAIIKDELNVKHIAYATNITDHAELKLKVNFPVLGKRLPHKMKDIIAASKQGKWQQQGEHIVLCDETLTKEECELQLQPKNPKAAQSLSSNDALVMLDTELTEELKQEGIARDVVRLIQQSRKEADLNIADRIVLHIASNDDVIAKSVANFATYITEQTLATRMAEEALTEHQYTQHLQDQEITISFAKAQ